MRLIKKSCFTLLFSAAISTSSIAQVIENDIEKLNFVQLNIGLSKGLKPGEDYKSGSLGKTFIYGIEAGREVYKGLRLSLSLDQRSNYKNSYSGGRDEFDNFYDSSKIKAKSTLMLLNSYFDIYNFSGIKPYVGLGLGLSRNQPGSRKVHYPEDENQDGKLSDTNVVVPGKSSFNFAYKIAAGSRYSITDAFSIDLKYQFLDAGKFKSQNYEYENGNKIESPSEKGKLRSHEFIFGVAYNF